MSAPPQKGFTLWFTGLSGAGKTTLSRAVNEQLMAKSVNTEILDGDIVRENLSKGLGFSREDRDINVRRIGFVAGLLTRHGAAVLVSAISPFRETRESIKQDIENFIEVFVNAPVEVCEERDVKGLYKRARAGEIANFTGISDPYEPPEQPEIEIYSDKESLEESVERVMTYLKDNQFI